MRIFISCKLHRKWLHNKDDGGEDKTSGVMRRNDHFLHLIREAEAKSLLTKYKL
jgi:hypothetical protein